MMNIYKTDSAADLLKGNAYAGRGIIIGTSANGRYAVTAYFIMGRSQTAATASLSRTARPSEPSLLTPQRSRIPR